jgi:hypothetical protein
MVEVTDDSFRPANPRSGKDSEASARDIRHSHDSRAAKAAYLSPLYYLPWGEEELEQLRRTSRQVRYRL